MIRKILVTFSALSTLGLASAAHADVNYDQYTGFYVGGQAGYGNTDYGNNDIRKAFQTAPNYSTSEGGFAGRLYAGYQFNQYLGLEAGYTFFPNNTYEANDGLGNSLKLTVKTQQADLLAKVGMPFGDSGFRGDIKAGAAYIRSSADVTASSSFLAASASASDSQNNWAPAAGVSIAYNFTQNIAMDVSYLHAFGSGDSSSPNTDLITLGVSYMFA